MKELIEDPFKYMHLVNGEADETNRQTIRNNTNNLFGTTDESRQRDKRRSEERLALHAKHRIRGIEDTLFSIKCIMDSDDFKPRTLEHHAMLRLVQMTEERLEEYKQTWEAYADKYDLEKGII